ncbi:helix-turn-helix domain-containing protein [Rhizobium sp. HT1-10]|uniref:helix-turn-helix domain-containing protein n=1 Tax=Rhizobium sp. HT1-10 TaxID=3111638 RepID=UPI003C25B8BD
MSNPTTTDPKSAEIDTLADVGTRIRTTRGSFGYSVDDLAETVGLTADEIVAIEAGNDNDPAKIKRIASALKVELPDA